MKQFLVLALMVFCGNVAYGQTTWTPPTTGGTYYLKSIDPDNSTNFQVREGDNGSYSGNYTQIYGLVNLTGNLTLKFENDTTILYDAHFFLNTDNASVTLELGNGGAHTANNPTLRIIGVTGYNDFISGANDNRTQVAFFLRPSTSNVAANHQVIIKGKVDPNSSTTDPTGLSFANNFVIDGDGPELEVDDGTTLAPKVKAVQNSSGNLKTYALVRLQQGKLKLENVTIQNFSTKYGNSGAIQVFTNNTTAAVDLEFDHCLFTNIASTNSPVLRMQGAGGTNENRDARIKNCKFERIFGAKSLDQLNVFGGDSTSVFTDNANATVRTLGNNKVPLTLDNCHFIRNYGCPVRWHGCGSAKDMVVNNCLVEDSFTKKDGSQVYGGGGLLLKGPATITYCTIRNNRTDGSGGGIYLSTYVDFNDGTPELVPEHSILRLDPNTKIYNNIAKENGGGVAIEAQLMRNPYNESLSSYNYIIYFTPSGQPFKTQFIQNGGEIYNNTALGNYGGGVYITRSEQTPFYEVICSLDYGKIYNNKTGTTGTTGNGGGVAIKTYRDEQCSFYNDENPPADIAAQDVIVEMSYPDANPASTEEGEMMRIDNNKANNGGGVYVEAYPNTLPNNNVPNKVDVNVYGLAKVAKNKANNNGGGLYVEYGTVRINSGTFGGTTESLGNIAENDGGGIYLNNGDIFTDVLPHAETGGGGGGTGPGGGGGGGGYVSPLPEGYTELDYIESTSQNQYINTGLNLNYQYTLWIDALLPNFTPNNNKGATLIWAGSTNDHRMGCAFFNSGKLVRSWGNNQADVWTHANLTSSGINIANRFQVLQNSSQISISQGTNSKTSSYTGTSSGTSGYNILIGKSERSGISNNSKGALRIFHVKIWSTQTSDPENTGDLLRNLYPCKRDLDGVIGMYDLKNNVFYSNPGTGTFTAGPVVSGGRSVAPSGSESLGLPPFAHNNNGKVGGTRAATAGCTISYNTATRDGGGCYVNHGSIFLMNAKVNNNKAANGKGGGIFTENGSVYVNYWDPQDPKNGLNYSVRNEQNPSQINNNSAELNGGGIITRFGKVLMRGQTHEANKHIQVSGNTTTQGSGGGIFCLGGSSASTTDEYVRLINVKIQGNQATSGTGIDSVMMGDGITKVGVSNGCGGGVYLQHGVINMTRCELRSNSAHVNGGGINDHSGNINIKGCIIDGNTAGAGWGENNPSSLCSGGGIFTVRGDVDIQNYPIGSDIYYTTQITNNTAYSNGGGITTRQGKVTVKGEYGSATIGGTEIKKSILIQGNKAIKGSGGGVFCLGDASTTPTTYIDFSHVDLIGNEAESGEETTDVTLEDGTTVMTVSNGCGGGIYLQRGVIEIENNIIQQNEANKDGGGVYNHGGEIDVDGCLIGGEAADGNKARNSGGGIYTYEGDIDIEDIVLQTDNTLVRLESKIRYNTAEENGGGINTHKGTITVNGKQLDDQIEISHNTANKGGGIYANEGTIIAYNAKIDNNTAQENGGGINNHSGNISIYGGSLSNNTATEGGGGGAYTNVGDINIKPFNPDNAKRWLNLSAMSDGTRIYNNIALMNGGGLNNHTGLIDLHYAMVQNNTSTLGNGGGIYCEGPHASGTGFTIRLLRSILNQNKTRGQDGTETAPTGRGGGIYLHYGRIFAQGSDITFNKANINGGGINNHEGNIRTYGCKINNNVATTGHGGGIYANKGLIVVGPSGVAGASVIQRNTAGNDGGGINNHEGDIQINGDLILDNEAGQDGGGIYLALGNITMNGGKIDNNSAVRDGGGVYMGGTKPGNDGFLIQERTPGVPFIETINIEDFSSNTATVHYHLIDDGHNSIYLDEVAYPPGSASNPITHGIIVKCIGDDGNETDLPSGVSAAIETIPNGDVPGCRRRKITFTAIEGIDLSEIVFSVKAFAEYTPDGSSTPLRGESTPVTFQLYSNKPVVFTGTASNITATSANVNGKLVFKGNADVLENAIGIQYSVDKNMSDPSYKFVSSATENVPVFPEGSYYTVSLDFGQPANNYATRKFYLRAIATNSASPAQTAYGEIDSITLPKNTPYMGTNLVEYEFVTINEVPSIKFSFEMPNSVLGDNYSNYGFVLSTDDDPELNKDHTINKNNVEIDPNNSKKFSATVPLSVFYNSQNYPSFNYYVRAFATAALNEPDAMDVTNYSVTAATKFVIPTPDGDPVVRLVSISNIAQDSAVVKAIVVIRGNEPITKYGLCWSDDASVQPTATGGPHITVREANANPNYYQNPAPGNVGDSTYFTVIMSPLVLNTTYYLRVFATNVASPSANDYVYGNDFNFTTLSANPPVVYLSVNDIKHDSATIVCTVNNGGSNVTEYGIYWGLDAPNKPLYKTTYSGNPSTFSVILPDISSNTTVDPAGSPIPTTLTMDTVYKVYAYAINGIGTYMGREMTFRTTYDKPTFGNVEIVRITYDANNNTSQNPSVNHDLDHTITVKGKITSNGDHTPTEYGFVYSANISEQPTLEHLPTEWDCGYVVASSSPTQGTDYTAVLSANVNANKEYLIRPYAKVTNSSGTVEVEYGNAVTALTLPQVNRGDNPSNITLDGMTLHGLINTNDPEGHLKQCGFCWVAANPSNPTPPATLTIESALAANQTSPGSGGSVPDLNGSPNIPNYTAPYAFNMDISSFNPGTKYYWRAWVRNELDSISYSTISADYVATWTYGILSEVMPSGAGSVTPVATTGEGLPTPVPSGGNVYCDAGNFPVTLTAYAHTGYVFNHCWDKTYIDGGGNEITVNIFSTDNQLEINNPESATFTAYFNPVVNWAVNGDGSVTGVDGNNNTVTSGSNHPVGTTIILTATPNGSNSFVNWTDEHGNEWEMNPLSIVLDGPVSLTANFSDGRGNASTSSVTVPRPRDIYPAPAREPWDWEDDIFSQLPMTDGNRDGEPTVTTSDPDKQGLTVTCGGSVTAIGSSNVTAYGICWSLYPNPTTVNSKTTVTEEQSGAFTIPPQTMTGLDPNETYYVRAYATNAAGTGYGAEKTVTLSLDASVLTNNVTNLTLTDDTPPTLNATVSGTVIVGENLGDAIHISHVGVWYSSEGPEYTTNTGTTQEEAVGAGTTFPYTFQTNLTGLSENNVYYARAYAKFTDGSGKSEKIIYGDSRVFLYNNNRPVITNNTAGDAGGGIYVAYNEQNPARIMFSGGENKEKAGLINNNYAKNAGGGIYISELAIMNMKCYCEVNNNHVDEIVPDPAHPDIKKGGGGIYLDGILKVGENPEDQGKHSLMVDHNWAGNEGYEYDPSRPDVNNRNNVYLPNDPDPLPESECWNHLNGDPDPQYGTPANNGDKQRVITLLSDIAGRYYTGEHAGTPVTLPMAYPNEPTAYYTKIGISVDHGFRGVIYTPMVAGSEANPGDETSSHEKWLIDLVPAQGGALNGAFFDDANMYYALHVQNVDNPDDLKRQYDYLYGCWTTAVRVNPNNYPNKFPLPEGLPGHFTEDSDGTWHIYTKYGLAWFTSWVNGFNGNIAHPAAKAFIERDMDMSEHIWIPIGSSKPYAAYGTEIAFDDGGAYVGEFNGQGNLITGLQCRYATGVKKYGLFGTVTKSIEFDNIAFDEGGTVLPTTVHQTATGNGIVKNTFVDEYRYWTFQIGSDEAYAYKIGGIAGDVTGGGTVCASEARGLINIPECVPDQTYVGGLVGMAMGTPATTGDNPSPAKPVLIHSSMAMPEIKGVAKYVGGLVGYLNATDSLLNSFSNSKFTGSPYNNSITVGGSTETVYFGGLVGVNDGLVENCYSRLQGNEPTNGTTSIFGWLAGTNNDSIKFSYAPFDNGRVYKKAGNKNPKGHGTYTDTQRYSDKYGFKHRDHQMTPADSYAIHIVTDGTYNKTNDTLIGGLQHSLNDWVKTATNGWNATNNTNTKGYAVWTRTMASPINDDYPIPMLDTMNKIGNKMFNSVGSKDGIYMLYEDNVNDMWAATGKNFKACNTDGSVAAIYLYDVQPGDVPADVEITGNVNVPLYIHEEIGITQPDKDVDNNVPALTVRAGVTIKNANGRIGGEDFTKDPNWHLFSSAIKDVPMGLEYYTDTSYSSYYYRPPYSGNKYSVNIPGRPEGLPGPSKDRHSHTIWSNRNYFDPPHVSWFQSDRNDTLSYNKNGKKIGYFPTNTPYGTWRPNFDGHTSSRLDGFFDLYCYSEEFYHWINFKREGSNKWLDHWHMDVDDNGDHLRLDYGYNLPTGENSYSFTLGNEPCLLTGKGYMMALSSESMMMADGQLNTGDIYAPVTLTAVGTNNPRPQYRYDEPWRTLNLVGNPYQSYLDFDTLAKNDHNKGLLYSVPSNEEEGKDVYCYATRDDNNHEFIFYTMTQSRNEPKLTASRYIHPHQGFFIKVKASGNLKFTDYMRVAGTNVSLGSNFRDGGRDYPLVNLICYESSGHRDFTTVEVNRPSLGGGYKMKNLRTGNASIYARLENEDYQTLFTPVGTNIVPVWFETNSDDVFTLRWSTLHGTFSYLHLIDNLMGADIDCLTTEEYRFEASVEDYKSRFKLVFRCDEEPDEPDEPDEPNESDHFAFMFGDELIVNGEGMLQMFDVQGRCLMTTRVAGGQSSVSLPKVACGVYLLRLIGNDKVKVQKMVIK